MGHTITVLCFGGFHTKWELLVITSGLTREGLANAMSKLNGDMKVSPEELDTIMQDAAVDECVRC